jgi:hypothetical protein
MQKYIENLLPNCQIAERRGKFFCDGFLRRGKCRFEPMILRVPRSGVTETFPFSKFAPDQQRFGSEFRPVLRFLEIAHNNYTIILHGWIVRGIFLFAWIVRGIFLFQSSRKEVPYLAGIKSNIRPFIDSMMAVVKSEDCMCLDKFKYCSDVKWTWKYQYCTLYDMAFYW